jgi:cytoskeletal protein CcmA (bactofilin family)
MKIKQKVGKILTNQKKKILPVIKKAIAKQKSIFSPLKEKEQLTPPIYKPEIPLKLEVKKVLEEKVSWIGSSISIKGEILGNEDLHIDGQVEGKIVIRDHTLMIGREAKLKAEIQGKIITIDGNVSGNVYGTDKVMVKEKGRFRGNIISPRISIADGANFKGKIRTEKPSSVPPFKEKNKAKKDPL